MMAVPKTPFDVARSVRAPLSQVETIALECIERIAKEGRQATQQEIKSAVGANSHSTAPGIVKRLEEKGYITREKYQRGMVVCVKSLGICTAEPANKSPHWRDTPRQPSPAIQTLRQSAPMILMSAEQIARSRDMPLPAYLEECVRRCVAEDNAERNEG